ncbi:MAG: SRPBCC family protein [Armatimonadetes bacterium]|nr:SRPBCC family protein [Armatimonadota bacterium]
MKIRNVHSRRMPVPVQDAGRLLDLLGGPDDPLWPRKKWPALRLDRPLGAGARGGHGPIRYFVEEYLPGRRVTFRFERPGLIRGVHYFQVRPAETGCVLEHAIEAWPGWYGWLLWPVAVRWLHDALIEDALDNAEKALTGAVPRPARWSPWVRWLRALAARLGI